MLIVPKMASWHLCNISKKKGGMKLIFLHADKHETCLQVDPINRGRHGQACPNYPK